MLTFQKLEEEEEVDIMSNIFKEYQEDSQVSTDILQTMTAI
jgi:hypothetical protein